MPGPLKESLLGREKANVPFTVSSKPPTAVLLNPLAWLLWALDFLLWLVTIVGPVKWAISLCKKTDAVQNNGIFRNSASKDTLLTSPDGKCKTVHDCMQHAFATYGKLPACGTRKYLGTYKPEGAKFPLAKFGETSWMTYAEFGQNTTAFGAGLLRIGLKPCPAGIDLQTSDGPHSIIIFEDTCAEWATALIGAFSQSIAVGTSYATLGMNSVMEAVNETAARAVVCNIKDVSKVATLASKCPTLQAIIYTVNNSLELKSNANTGSLQCYSVSEVIALGKGSPVPFSPPTPDHLGVVMYTSGSTGKPKGVMIPHRCLVASIASLEANFKQCGFKTGSETYLAYLPAAHIMELVLELFSFYVGSAIGYADPKTISSKGACRERPDGTLNTAAGYPYPAGAIQEFRPTCMAAVPKIWDILKKGVEDVLGKGSPVKRFLFQVAFSGRYMAVHQGRESPLFKALVFKKLSDMLGGRLKIGISGGGPISADVQSFIRTAFAIPLIQGYALTETTCAGTVQQHTDCRNGLVGRPLPSIEIKLRSCVNEQGEAEVMDRSMKPYLSSDTMHYGEKCKGRGEILLRGASLSMGYFKQPQKTAEVFDKEGWFHSGDVGLFTPDGCIKIVDRVKNLVKLKGGEYVAIESMEKEYSTSIYVNSMTGGLLCHGDGEIDRPVALVQANMHELEKWAKQVGVTYTSAEDLCNNPEANKLVLDSLVAAAKSGGLGGNEVLCAIALIPGTGPEDVLTLTSPWTPQNQGLTASNKLNRQPILMACDKLLQPLRAQAIR